jgi:hypothetical protein
MVFIPALQRELRMSRENVRLRYAKNDGTAIARSAGIQEGLSRIEVRTCLNMRGKVRQGQHAGRETKDAQTDTVGPCRPRIVY